MYIHNASFMMEREREGEFTGWLRRELRDGFDFEGDAAGPRRPMISAMRMAGGEDYRNAEAQTVAFQVEFATLEGARAWSEGAFGRLARGFETRFGPNAMVFVSIFERLEL